MSPGWRSQWAHWLSGLIGALCDGDTLRFDATSGVFVVRGNSGRSARVDAPNPLRAALEQVLARGGWTTDEPAEIVVSASEAGRITVRAAGFAASSTLGALPELLRGVPVSTARCAPETKTAALFAKVSDINGYFAIGTGPVDSGWRSVAQLYTDAELLEGLVDRVQARIGAAEQPGRGVDILPRLRRAAVVDRARRVGRPPPAARLDAEDLFFREIDGQIRLHIERPVSWQGDDRGADAGRHGARMASGAASAALRRLGPISQNYCGAMRPPRCSARRVSSTRGAITRAGMAIGPQVVR